MPFICKCQKIYNDKTFSPSLTADPQLRLFYSRQLKNTPQNICFPEQLPVAAFVHQI